MTEQKMQELADKKTCETMTYLFGLRFTTCNNLTEDEEMDNVWEILNEEFYNLIYELNN